MISQPQSEGKSWLSPVLDAFGSGMSAIGSLGTAFQRKPKRDIKRGVISPELVSKAAQSVFDLTKMAESHFERYGSFTSLIPMEEKYELEFETFYASLAIDAVTDYDLGLSEVCGRLEDPDGKFRMASGRASKVIEPLVRYCENNNWSK
jgi:hypothetical protein